MKVNGDKQNSLIKLGMIFLALLIMLAVMGVSQAGWSDIVIQSGVESPPEPIACFTWVVSNDDSTVGSVAPYGIIDTGDDGGGTEYDRWGPLSSNDPYEIQTAGQECGRYTKDVARTTATVVDCRHIDVQIENGYPCYYPTIFFGLRNVSTCHGIIQSIEIDEDACTEGIDVVDELTVGLAGVYVGQILEPGEELIGSLYIHIEQCAEQNAVYKIRVKIVIVQNCGGTIGFWGNWKAHKTYTQAEIDGWLQTIDAASLWLVEDMDGNGLIDVGDMEAIFARGLSAKGATRSKYQFLAHYLATRLGAESGRITDGMHVLEPNSYLGLEGAVTLGEIINAIESKYPSGGGAWPTKDQYEIMKDICDALNNVEI